MRTLYLSDLSTCHHRIKKNGYAHKRQDMLSDESPGALCSRVCYSTDSDSDTLFWSN